MAKYTNIGNDSITVRGVTVKPGETKELKGFANDRNLVRYNDPISSNGKVRKNKPAVEPARAESKPQVNQNEIKHEPDKGNQSEPKKENK